MSWDVMIFNFDSPPLPVFDKWPDDLMPIPLGETESMRAKISRSLPGVDWSDPTWGDMVGDGHTIEFNFGQPTMGFMLHVRGSGDALPPICRLCSENGWYAYDCSTGDFIELANPSRAGWEGFQSYRNRVIGDVEQSDQE